MWPKEEKDLKIPNFVSLTNSQEKVVGNAPKDKCQVLLVLNNRIVIHLSNENVWIP